jgi:peptidyl-prolyl cis-trans isomerase SurA
MRITLTIPPATLRYNLAAVPLRGWGRQCLSVALFMASLAAVPLCAQPSAAPVVLDSVVAIVNRQAILQSDVDEEIRLSVLDPALGGQGTLTPAHALEQLISRALIDQQLRREDMQNAEPTQEVVNARLAEIRRELPACVHGNCASDAGWDAFLAAHELSPERVIANLRYRLEILSFIEQRFRPGIHISPQDIETYYKNTLLPQYGPGENVPTLQKVSPRIEEILLQQQVNLMFDDWLTNLRHQGDVEVLDPALETQPAPSAIAPPVQSGPAPEKGKGSQ